MSVPKILMASLLVAYGARVRYQGLLATESLLEDSVSEPKHEVAKSVATPALLGSVVPALYGWMTSSEKLLFKKLRVADVESGLFDPTVLNNTFLSSVPELQEASILRAKRILGASTVFAGLGAAHAMYVGGKFVVEKNKAQKELMLSDLTEEIQGLNDRHEDVESLAAALDFASSNKAFNDAEQAIWDQATGALSISTVPTSADGCHARFTAALEPLRGALCQATCRNPDRKCDCEGKDFESPLDEPMKTIPTTICDNFLSWKGTATEQELERFWPRHLDQLRTVVRKVLADNFPSPALMATSTEAMLIDFANKISGSCALNSSWWNPLGKAAQAARQVTNRRFVGPRDIIEAKVAQIQKAAHNVTCPALRLSLCRAGCAGYEACAESVQKEEEDFVVAVSYKPVYCRQMLDFASRLQPLCSPGWENFKALAKTFASVSSWLATGAMTYYSFNDVSHVAEVASYNALPAFFFALQSTTRLFRDMVAGLQDGAEACTEVAKKIMEGSQK